jgi:Xaa-Pro aminopeptidase
MSGASLWPREDGVGPDFGRMRAERRRRLFEAAEAAGLDALVLGRPANLRYATGLRQLWRSGAFPFAPACVLVTGTGRIHLLSSWDEGVPPEIPHEDLYGLTWNPATLTASLRGIPGLAGARRLGSDAVTTSFLAQLTEIASQAELVDASGLLAGVRAIKTADELLCIEMAAGLAEAGLAAMEAALSPGVTERELLAVLDERLALLGAPTPSSEGVAFATEHQGAPRLRQLVSDRPVREGELVVLAPGALYGGYEGGLARTRRAGGEPSVAADLLAARCDAALDALIAVCRPGTRGAELIEAWERAGEPVSPIALAHGIGLGAEPPLVGFGLGAGEILAEGMVLSVQAWVAEEGIGGVLGRELIHVGHGGPELMTRSERWRS